ncbi:lipid II:glycine glycyltransferase (peptidoglycan interpeptide bridge formation enzyme) [Lysinibacillus composti]|uniref:Lipid II:glycine glycyltransferase n=1 Tax=Lysinibacillus composti TaxID=720633 RepID=A0A3N9UKY6_9BACI|nr:peptidoglycan bridge formation glycyltransferase FemA/FemB family protein [Lysinibacillus composti]MBM7606793.1 lipid II:glycine glycyltransferase (peptidoglycan interpeptide bridge formation enzyme) [Lysinibacillus composti]RQW76594.1 peptidoglycan bridge formation glycyltransferase FemA/FemB family protein [Lysinibacillus composti]
MPVVDQTNAADLERYEQFVRTAPFATATQDTGWSHVKNNWRPLYVYLEEDGQIIAAMSILMVNAVGDQALAYCCKGPVCDPKDTELVDKLMKEAARYAKEENAFLLRIDPEVLYDEDLVEAYQSLGYRLRSRNVSSHDTTQPRFNMVLDLKGKTEEELLASFHKKTRYNIRLAERKGVTTRFSQSIDDLKVFYDLYVTMSERHGITYRPYNYYERMLEAYGENFRVYLAEHEGDIIAGALALSYGDKTWYAYGGSPNVKRNLMAPHLLQWEMIKWAVEQKKNRYDFGGVFELNDSDGLYRFKEGFCYPDNYTEYLGEIDYVLDEEAYQTFISR